MYTETKKQGKESKSKKFKALNRFKLYFEEPRKRLLWYGKYFKKGDTPKELDEEK